MKILITQSQASREMAKHIPVPKLDELNTQENAFLNPFKSTLGGHSELDSFTKTFQNSVCPYIQIGCLVSQMSRHCNNDYTQCQTYKYYERWGK